MDNSVVQTQNMSGTAQTVQVPNYSGVNIQIFNPSVAAPGATTPQSTVNAPTYTTCPGQCYPQNYYTQNFTTQAQPQAPTQAQVLPQSQSQSVKVEETPQKSGKKTEEREIVELTDEYVKSLENYLNNENKEIRLTAAKDVIARFEEDKSRKDDPALNALLNKMLQDPYQPVKFIAMSALESRMASGDNNTRPLLETIQQTNPKKDYEKEDPIQASSVLLKMAGTTTKKVFEVDENKKSKKDS